MRAPAMGSSDVRASVETAESSLPPTPSTLASLRVSTDTWSQLLDSPATGQAAQFTETQLLAAELEARNQALRLLLERRSGKPSVESELSIVSEGGAVTPEAVTNSPQASVVDAIFSMMEDKKLRTLDLFAALDRDKGGTLDATELKMAFAQHGMHLDQSMAKSILRILDQDGDGKVDSRVFVEQMRMLKNARRSGAPEPEPEPEPEPAARRVPSQQRPRTARASSKVMPRALTPQAAASAARLSGHAASAGVARSQLTAKSLGSGLPPWVPGGTSVRSSASSIGSGVDSLSLSAHAARAQTLASGQGSKLAGAHTAAARHAQANGRGRGARRPRPAWASPPPAETIAPNSHVAEHVSAGEPAQVTRRRRQLAQIVMNTSAQAVDIESQYGHKHSTDTIGVSTHRREHNCPAAVAVAATRTPEEDRIAQLPRALEQIQHDLAELRQTGRSLRGQLRRAVRDYGAGRETTVFDLRCNREHQGYPALMLQSNCD